MANERICLICNTRYSHCGNCPSGRNKPTWLNIYDKEECKEIFEICSAYKNGYMSKGDAMIKLKSFVLPEHINKKYQDIIDEIMFVEKKPRRAKKIEVPVEEEPEELVVNEDLE